MLSGPGSIQDYLLEVLLVFVSSAPFAGLAIWAHAANKNKPARVALLIIFALLGGAELLFGALLALANQLMSPDTPSLIAVTIALLCLGTLTLLLLLPQVRGIISVFTPISLSSAVDMAGFIVLLHVLGGSLALLIGVDVVGLAQAAPSDQVALSIPSLVIQSLMYPIIAFFAVGVFITRGLRESWDRLGLRLPPLKYIGLALVVVAFALATDMLFQSAMQQLQPGELSKLDNLMQDMFGNLLNPAGALAVGLTAGIGEELLFRGAIQPRFGIVFTAAVFASIHLQYGFSLVLLQVFLFAVLLGLLRWRSGTVTAMIAHTVYNTTGILLATYLPGP